MARFSYDNMAQVHYVEDAKVPRLGWTGLTSGTDVTGATRPTVELHIIGEPRADLGDALNRGVDDRSSGGER